MTRTRVAVHAGGVELGLGLIGIGRPWPTPEDRVSTEAETVALLDRAVGLGLRFFDTAPAYGESERRLGAYLAGLSTSVRNELTVATKCGEYWSLDDSRPNGTDHRLSTLDRTVHRSLELLGRIDLLQLHKCTVQSLADETLVSWFADLRANGVVRAIGVSVSTAEAVRAAVDLDVFDAVQFPANIDRRDMAAAFTTDPRDCLPLLNRPMNSGALTGVENPFAYHVQTFTEAVVLTGTRSPEHLASNVALFRAAHGTAAQDGEILDA